MKITSVNIAQDDLTLGLSSIKLDRLGNIVMLAGANGAGKSRILSVISNNLMQKPTNTIISQAQNNIIRQNQNIKNYQAQIDSYTMQIKNYPARSKNLDASIKQMQTAIKQSKEDIELQTSTIEWDIIKTDTNSDTKISVVQAVPKSVSLRDYRIDRPTDSNKNFLQVSNLGVAYLQSGTLIYIKKIQSKAFNASHQNSTISPTERQTAIAEGCKLEELIKNFLGASLGRDLDGEPLLFGKIISQSGLSDGQKILLQLSVQIHAQGADLTNLIIMMDEPENHLHPAASIDMISAIKDAAPDCQIWIATHSLPILSYFNDATLLLSLIHI